MIQSITSPLRIPLRETAGTIAAAIADNDRQWVERIERYAQELYRSWNEFEQLVTIVDEELGGEVTEDDAGDLFAAFSRLRKLGVRFDPTFIQRIDELVPGDRSSESFIEDGYDVVDNERDDPDDDNDNRWNE